MRALKIIVPILLSMLVCGGIFYAVVMQPKPIPTSAPPVQPVATVPIRVEHEAHLPYSLSVAQTESALYAQETITHVALYSGLGVALQPDASELTAMLHTANRDHLPFENPALLKVPYVRGNSLLPSAQLNLLDGLTYRWNAVERHTKVTPETVARAMDAEVALATYYATNTAAHDKRFEAIALAREASEGMKFLESQMKLPSGLYASGWQGDKVLNDNSNVVQQGMVLGAYAKLIDYAETFPSLYVSPVDIATARAAFDGLLRALRTYVSDDETRITTLPQADLAHMMQSFSWYILLTPDSKLNRDAKDLLTLTSDALKLSQSTAKSPPTVTTEAAKVQGFEFASLVIGDAGLSRNAAKAWATLDSLWNETHRLYEDDSNSSMIAETPDTVAEIVGAYRFAKYISQQSADEESTASGAAVVSSGSQSTATQPIEDHFAAFIETAVKESGLMPSEDREADALIPNDGVPLTTLVHKAPVFIAECAYLPADARWITLDANVDTAGALHLASELLTYSSPATTKYMHIFKAR